MDQRIAVLGAGSWGTALAVSLSNKGHQVNVWDIDQNHLAALETDKENKKYLPGVFFSDKLKVSKEVQDAVQGVDIVLFAAPAQHFRSAFEGAFPYITKNMVLVNVAKGIEQKTLLRLSQIALEKMPDAKYVVVCGPSHAEEVGKAMPTTLVAACPDLSLAEYVQDVFMTDQLRMYTSADRIGAELGGALKNIIALGAGISDGLAFGDNAKAALMTRGIAEISRLGIAMGAKAETFSGLTGIGDLIVTCTSMHSRNRRCGIMIGEGLSPTEAIAKVGMVVEGMYTTEAAKGLAKRYAIDMPITEAIYQVIEGTIDAKDAVTSLMTRQKKHEQEKL